MSNVSTTIELSGRTISGSTLQIQLKDGHIAGIGTAREVPDHGWLVPGFFDIQVNGFAGIDFCNPQLTIEQVEQVAHAVLATGVTRFLPTIITAAFDDMCRELTVLSTAIEQSPLVRAMCPGIHVEGPFIHPEDGPRGAHPRAHVRPPSIADFERLRESAGSRIKLLTVAADQPGVTELIAHATRARVVVAIGHHRAETHAIDAAIEAGAKMVTHLGNGSDALMPRFENPVWRQLGEDRLWASFIADGHHLPAPVLRAMLRAKTTGRSILVTDAMSGAGMPPGHYRIGPVKAERTPSGKVVLPGTPYLAGSGADMPLCVATATRLGGIPFEQAVRLASLNPGHLLLGEPLDWTPAVGDLANLVELDWNEPAGQLCVRRAVIGQFSSS